MQTRRAGAVYVEREVFLRSLTLARPTGASARALAASMEDLHLPAGTVIYREGDPGEAAYFVVNGTVRLTSAGHEPWTLGAHAVVGVLDVMAERSRTRQATIVEDAHVLRLRADDWLDILEDDFEYTRHVVRGVASTTSELCFELAPGGGFAEPPPDAPGIDETAPPLTLVERIIVLRDTELFARATIDAMTTLAEGSDEIRVPAGSLLSERVSLFAGFSVVARGLVEMTSGEPSREIRARFGPSAIVGGPVALAHSSDKLAVRALTDTSLLHVRDEDFYDVMEDHFDVARSVFAALAVTRERLMNQRASKA